MKKLLLSSALFLISFIGFSQTKGISYQAVIIDPNPIEIPGKDVTAQPYVSKDVWIRFGIYAGTTLQYEELHKTKTDEYGLVNLIIGAGVNTGKAGTFTSLSWDGITKSIITNVSFDQGGRYTEVSNQKLNYVPYTLLAETAVKLAGVLPIASGGTGATNAIAARTNLGLGNVDNTADADKPVSIATLAILDTKEAIANKSTNIIADSASSVKYPSVKAIKDYVDLRTSSANNANLAAKATALATPRTINGVAFDGTANITIPVGVTPPDANATTKGLVQLAGDLTGTAAAPAIAANSVTTAKIIDGAITNAKITSVAGSKVTGDIAGNAATATLATTATSANTATKLTTARTINGTPFDGTSDITITTNASTLSGTIGILNGGTGASTAAGARTNLGLVIGTDVLAQRTFGTAANSAATDFVAATEKGANNGVATLGNNGKIPSTQIPAISFQNVNVVNSDAAMIGIAGAQVGSIAIRTDNNNNYVLSALPASTLSNWIALATPLYVSTVNGYAGPNVVLTTNDVAEGTANKYFTDARVRNALSAVAPLNFNTTSGVLSMTAASGSSDGYLSSADFTRFNNKQTALTAGVDYATPSGNITGNAANVTGIVSIANGGTGTSTATGALVALGAEPSANKSNDVDGDGSSITKFPTVKSIKDYVDRQSANAGVADNSITSAKINGTIAIAKGGTGASTAAGARTNLGLAIGTDVMAANATTALTGDVSGSGNGSFATTVNSVGGVSSSTIATLPGLISANTTAVAANTASITANTNSIATLNTNVSANTTSITANTNSIATLNTNVSANTASITANTNSIATLNTNVAANTTSITANTTAIATNTASIATNATAITTEATTARAAELTLTNSVNANTASITANANSIATLNTNVSANTASITANSTDIATINTNLALKAPLASPAFTGTPTAPTPATNDNSTKVATTEYVQANLGTVSAGTLTGTTLASTITGSSLTSVGTITSGVWSATEIAINKGGTGATTAAGALTNLGAEASANKSTATNLGGVNTSDVLFPTQKAVKAYVDAQTAAAGVADGSITNVKLANSTTILGTTTMTLGGTVSSVTGLTSLAATNLTGTLSGTATALATGRTISTTGDVTYTSGSFDGSANVTGVATLAASGVTSGTYGSSTAIPVLTVDSKGRVTTASTVSIIAGVNTVTAIAGTSNANGATISGTAFTLTPADGTNGGVVTTGTQTFAGDKTFSNTTTFNTDISVNGYRVGKGAANVGSNVALGQLALNNTSTTGINNVAIGSSSMFNLTSGTRNIGVGTSTLNSLTTGNFNVSIGHEALKSISTGSESVAIGDLALTLATGGANTAVGHGAGTRITSGQSNTLLGAGAGIYLTTTSNNVVLGQNAGSGTGTGGANNTTGANSVFIGRNAQPQNDGQTNQVVLAGFDGTNSNSGLGSNTTLIGNSATTLTQLMGALNLPNTTASTSTSTGALRVGGGAGIAGNVYIGGTLSIAGGTPAAGEVLTSDANGLATWAAPTGVSTLTYSTTGASNGGTISGTTLTLTAADASNPGLISTGTQTIAGAKTFTNTATFNTDISVNGLTVGRGAGAVASNAALGATALNANTSGNYNVAVGSEALKSNTTGSVNVALGAATIDNLTSGNNNTVIGSFAGRNYGPNGGVTGNNTTMNNGILLGYDARPLVSGGTDEVVIGMRAIGHGSNTVTLGNSSNTKTFLTGDLSLTGNISSGIWSATEIAISKGGTGATTASGARTNLGLVIGTDVMAANFTTTLTGDVTGAGNGSFATTLAASGVNSGTYGSSTAIPTFTVDTKGRITSASSVAITAGVSTLAYSTTGASNGGTISGTTLTLTAADATNPGLISTGAQTIAGAKTFNSDVTATNFLGNATTATTASNISATSNTTLTSLSNLATVGTITAGTWSGSVIGSNVGGAGTVSGLLKANGSGVVSAAVAGTDYQAPLTAGTSYISPNAAITAATKTKITYDAFGLVTAGADATTADIAPSTNRNYVTDAQAGVISNTSGTNTGDETASTIKTKLGITTLSGSNTGDQTITLTGDVTGTGMGSFAATLTNTTVTAGAYGSSTAIPTITVDSKGRLTAASTASIVADAGTLTGTSLASTVTGSSLTSVGTITSGVWSGTAIANNKLANSTTTLGSTTMTLGGTVTSVTGLTSLTATTVVGSLSGTATTATNIAGGAIGAIPYQSAAGTTAILSGNTSTTVMYLTSSGNGTVSTAPAWVTPSFVPYSGATSAVDLGSYDLKVNGLTVGRGGKQSETTNTVLGSSALPGSNVLDNNVAIGYRALYSGANAASDNTVVGSNAGYYTSTGTDNTFIGSSAGFSNGAGKKNTAVGSSVLYNLSSGYANAGIGYRSLYSVTTGIGNIGIGDSTSYKITSGYNNISLGTLSLSGTTTGYENIAMGFNSLIANTTGYQNIGLGTGSLYWAQGNRNIAIGISALERLNSYSNNTAIGYRAGKYYGSGSNTNTATSIQNSVLIGYDVRTSTAYDDNSIVIAGYTGSGDGQAGLGSNSTLIGNVNTKKARIYGALTSVPAIATTTAGENSTIEAQGTTSSSVSGGSVTIKAGSNTSTGTAGNIVLTPGTSTTAANNGIVKVNGQIQITGGSPGAGEVLMSDANGLATWSYSIGSTVVTSTTTYAITLAEAYVFYTGSAAGAFTIPAAASTNAGKEITIKNKTAYGITITPASGTIFIDSANTGAASVAVGIEASNNWIKLVSDGTQWNVIRALF